MLRIGAEAGMVPVPPNRKEEVPRRRGRTKGLSKGGQGRIRSVGVGDDAWIDVQCQGEWPPGGKSVRGARGGRSGGKGRGGGRGPGRSKGGRRWGPPLG